MASLLDNADRRILEQLQQNTNVNLEQLAYASGLSIPSVQRRLRRLRSDGVIENEIAVLNPKALGQNMTFVVLVELERERLDQLDTFRRAARAEPQVQQCYYVTGEADFVLICIAQDMEDFEALTHRLFFENTNVRRFRTSVVMERSKVGLSIPVNTSENAD